MEDLALTDKQSQLIASLRARISELEGANTQPQRGCEITRLPLGNASVLVEFENTADPGEHPDIWITNVLVNGMWIDAEDNFTSPVIGAWIEALMVDTYGSAIEAAMFDRELARDLELDREAA